MSYYRLFFISFMFVSPVFVQAQDTYRWSELRCHGYGRMNQFPAEFQGAIFFPDNYTPWLPVDLLVSSPKAQIKVKRSYLYDRDYEERLPYDFQCNDRQNSVCAKIRSSFSQEDLIRRLSANREVDLTLEMLPYRQDSHTYYVQLRCRRHLKGRAR
jgi:hypothetical protein